MVNAQEAEALLSSVAVKLTVAVPLAVGVHANTLLTGLPEAGSEGVIVAPAGRPLTVNETLSPASASDACIVKLVAIPTFASMVEPHTGVGETNEGAVLGGVILQGRAR